VIEETSFDFRGLEVGQVNLFLSEFNDTLHNLRSDGIAAWKPPFFAETPCADDYDLYSYLLADVDRDVMRRFFSLADKCLEWDARFPDCDEVEVDGGSARAAWSISFAITAVVAGYGVACLVFGGCEYRGFISVVSPIGLGDVFFFSYAASLKYFWRSLYALEDIPEAEFFISTGRAFPALIFHPDLTFRRFQGSYRELREPVVHHLGELNDHFLREHGTAAGEGRLSDVEAYFGSHGVEGVSPESVKTRGNARAMRMRNVRFNGETFSCEWHTKLKPEIDRVHFAFGDGLADRILIGIFINHLPT
jgi:hypothetical protein